MGVTRIYRGPEVVVIESPEVHMERCKDRRYRLVSDDEYVQLIGHGPPPDEPILVQCDCGAYVQ